MDKTEEYLKSICIELSVLNRQISCIRKSGGSLRKMYKEELDLYNED